MGGWVLLDVLGVMGGWSSFDAYRPKFDTARVVGFLAVLGFLRRSGSLDAQRLEAVVTRGALRRSGSRQTSGVTDKPLPANAPGSGTPHAPA